MKILVDTNIVLDIILERQPFYKESAKLLQVAAKSNTEMFITATTITDLYYIVRKAKGRETAMRFVVDLLKVADIAAVDKNVVVQALKLDLPDFEDAIQASSAKQQGIDIIVTRNELDFANSGLEVHSPGSFLKRTG